VSLVYTGSAGFGLLNVGADVVSFAAFVACSRGFVRIAVMSAGERFTGKNVNGRTGFAGHRLRSRAMAVAVAIAGAVFMAVAMIVVFQIFKNVTDIQEGVAVQADVHESGLHAGKDACDFSFVDAADEGELFFALDVDFD
jgi:hypothetical protein